MASCRGETSPVSMARVFRNSLNFSDHVSSLRLCMWFYLVHTGAFGYLKYFLLWAFGFGLLYSALNLLPLWHLPRELRSLCCSIVPGAGLCIQWPPASYPKALFPSAPWVRQDRSKSLRQPLDKPEHWKKILLYSFLLFSGRSHRLMVSWLCCAMLGCGERLGWEGSSEFSSPSLLYALTGVMQPFN